MRKIAEQPPPKQALAIAAVLEQLGFNTQLLASEKTVLQKLQSLKAADLDRVREAFIHNKQPRFVKYFFSGMPYGKTRLYPQKVMEASLEKLAHLIKVCGLLLQTKVYLFWRKTSVLDVLSLGVYNKIPNIFDKRNRNCCSWSKKRLRFFNFRQLFSTVRTEFCVFFQHSTTMRTYSSDWFFCFCGLFLFECPP